MGSTGEVDGDVVPAVGAPAGVLGDSVVRLSFLGALDDVEVDVEADSDESRDDVLAAPVALLDDATFLVVFVGTLVGEVGFLAALGGIGAPPSISGTGAAEAEVKRES